MIRCNSSDARNRRRHRPPDLYRSPILLIIISNVLPVIVLVVISYFQAISNARSNLETIVNTATVETDRLLADADDILHHIKVDLKHTDDQTTVSLLQRQIYSDFRFREAGIFNANGLLTLTSLGVIDPPVPISFTKSGFDPRNPNMQILGPGRTQLMQERSIALILKGSEPVGGIYLLVDPAILTYFLQTLPNLNVDPNGFLLFITPDQRILNTVGGSSQTRFTRSRHLSFSQIQVTRATQDGRITIVGEISRRWALRYWIKVLTVITPITILVSGLLSYLFIRQVNQTRTLDYELKLGLTQNEFEVHYQPIVDLNTRQCVGSEALIRWRHPLRGMIYPGLFIPLAEQTGFIIPMTEWLIEKVIQDQATLQTQFHHLYTSINLSPIQLDTGAVESLVESLIGDDSRTTPPIVFEITENKLIENWATTAQDAIARLKQRGARFAIDDFGTGYSSISYLQKFDVDYLKLDQFFIKRLDQDNNSLQIIDSLIDLGNKLGLTTIAEGVETEVQCQHLIDRGVRYGQGWLFSRPLPFAEFEHFLQIQESAQKS